MLLLLLRTATVDWPLLQRVGVLPSRLWYAHLTGVPSAGLLAGGQFGAHSQCDLHGQCGY